jgi:hypothetical protein
VLFPGRLNLVLVVAQASASTPSRAPAGMANSGSGDTHTINSCHARSACPGDLRDHAFRLVNWCNCHCLC